MKLLSIILLMVSVPAVSAQFGFEGNRFRHRHRHPPPPPPPPPMSFERGFGAWTNGFRTWFRRRFRAWLCIISRTVKESKLPRQMYTILMIVGAVLQQPEMTTANFIVSRSMYLVNKNKMV
ncbi:hypothetical protein V3C99_010252, partial [Haemonchus contortus]